ncbi:gamma-glutamyltransferase family protein [Roseospira visakhapatnamensis]|uniref:Gamma-glutamyltranspeptidase/glutathione hydrolase n=1 Tax=Roseospira visakhapatnamensis TaxID=390880 RepID=A0A7W6RB80_9PROT|nr:gamma-glutamyltransferase [Roseospira visakhapatnamensis]MBB4265267.1 gamma-glutamyltranspeptidase/glutathione hydrolase [Roseospira visakhapatnamensis]
MPTTVQAERAMIVAPTSLAARAGLEVLREGGNAIEAVVAAAAVSAVVCPHLCGLAGDGLWLLARPGRPPLAIDATGVTGRAVTADDDRRQGLTRPPRHGGRAVATVPGAVAGWQTALEVGARHWEGRLPLARLLEDAIHRAEAGHPMPDGLARAVTRSAGDLAVTPLASLLLDDGAPPAPGYPLSNPALGQTLRALAAAGLDDFYRGGVGRAISADLKALGSPLVSDDLAAHRSVRRRPLTLKTPSATIHDGPPPTQGLIAQMVLGMAERLHPTGADGLDHAHGLIQAMRAAAAVRDRHLSDPRYMAVHPTTYLSDTMLDQSAAALDRQRARPGPRMAHGGGHGAWIGCIDAAGRTAGLAQTLHEPFGAGVLLPETGLLWTNQARAFQLDPTLPNVLLPGRKPPHGLTAPVARLRDGRMMVFGGTGGAALPMLQALLFTRHVLFGQDLAAALAAPRWRPGPETDLQVLIEDRLDPALAADLERLGHRLTRRPALDDIMGHLGAVTRHPEGSVAGAVDPRGDGAVMGL